MGKKTTQHYDEDGKHTERVERTYPDGSSKITESRVTDGPFGRVGSTIERETTIDKEGNSRTKSK